MATSKRQMRNAYDKLLVEENIKIELKGIISYWKNLINLSRTRSGDWLSWTRWGIFRFHNIFGWEYSEMYWPRMFWFSVSTMYNKWVFDFRLMRVNTIVLRSLKGQFVIYSFKENLPNICKRISVLCRYTIQINRCCQDLVWGCHSGECEEYHRLGCDIV